MRKTQLQALLIIGGVGAALALIQLLGVAGGLVGVGLMVVCDDPHRSCGARAGRRRAQLVGADRGRDGARADRRTARPGAGGAGRPADRRRRGDGDRRRGVRLSVSGGGLRPPIRWRSRLTSTTPTRGSRARSARRSCRRRRRRRSASPRPPASACSAGAKAMNQASIICSAVSSWPGRGRRLPGLGPSSAVPVLPATWTPGRAAATPVP